MAAVMQERDARATNRMDPETLVVHRRLEAWGRWGKDSQVQGFASSSPIARMMEFGINGAGAGSPPITMPEAIAEIDWLLTTIPKNEERAIRRYYLCWEPIEVSARALHMSVRDLQRLLQKARFRIGVSLDLNARINPSKVATVDD